MAKAPADVLNEWVLRGYITAEQSAEQRAKYLSYIDEAKTEILLYCRIPLNIKDFPEKLFYVWAAISWGLSVGGEFNNSTGTLVVKSVKEGDTSIEYSRAGGAVALDGNTATINYARVLNQSRNLF